MTRRLVIYFNFLVFSNRLASTTSKTSESEQSKTDQSDRGGFGNNAEVVEGHAVQAVHSSDLVVVHVAVSTVEQSNVPTVAIALNIRSSTGVRPIAGGSVDVSCISSNEFVGGCSVIEPQPSGVDVAIGAENVVCDFRRIID